MLRGLYFFWGTPHGETFFVCVFQRKDFCPLLLPLQRTGSMITEQGHSPSLSFPMGPVDTIGIQSLGLVAMKIWVQMQDLPSATGTKALPLTMGPIDTTLLGHQTKSCLQPGWMDFRTEGVGGSPGSRRPCSLVPGLFVQGPHLRPAFGESPGWMEAQSWMCQCYNLDVQAVPWLFWMSIFPSGKLSAWWQTVILRRFHL